MQYGLANALRYVYILTGFWHKSNSSSSSELFGPDFDSEESPAHRFLRSVHDIVIERGWFRLRIRWGDNMVIFFNRGIETGVYHQDNIQHM